jgi:hypothetical protein
MDAQIESLIELYLTRGGRIFVSPQYDVAYDTTTREGGSCPDIVALDIVEKEVVVVEVSSAWDLGPLYQKVEDRNTRWFNPIVRRLQSDKIIDPTWKRPRFMGFVRKDRLEASKRKFQGQDDVCFVAIEDAAFSFAYWTDRAEGLLDDRIPQRPRHYRLIQYPAPASRALAGMKTRGALGSIKPTSRRAGPERRNPTPNDDTRNSIESRRSDAVRGSI